MSSRSATDSEILEQDPKGWLCWTVSAAGMHTDSLACLSLALLVALFRTAGSKVIGGRAATPLAYPYMVSIQDRFGNHLCGGTLLDSMHVLTAAHCGSASLIPGAQASLYRHNISILPAEKEFPGCSTTIPLVTLVQHASFSGKPNFHHDIAIAKLARPVPSPDHCYTFGMKEAAPRFVSFGVHGLTVGTELSALGWGSVWKDGPGGDILRLIRMRAVMHNECLRHGKLRVITFRLCSARPHTSR